MKYIIARVRPAKTYFGYNVDNTLVTADMEATEFVEKVIQLSRILSFTEDYIFIECPHNTVQTWEYEGSLEGIKARLASAGLLLE